MNDLISRQAAIDVFEDTTFTKNEIRRRLSELQSVQPEPSEITDEQAILHLQSTGWMQNHDKEMYESGQKSMLADDSGSYDAIISDCYKTKKRFYNLSFLQPESECVFYDNDHGFCINTQDQAILSKYVTERSKLQKEFDEL